MDPRRIPALDYGSDKRKITDVYLHVRKKCSENNTKQYKNYIKIKRESSVQTLIQRGMRVVKGTGFSS